MVRSNREAATDLVELFGLADLLAQACVFCDEVVFVAWKKSPSEIASVKKLRNRLFSSVRAVVWRWRPRIDCNVAMLGFPRGVLAMLIGVAVRWFTFVNHGKFLDVISGNLYNELWKARTTLLFDGNIVFYCHMSLLRRFTIGKLHAP
jgi:hypothetical protein